MLRRMRIAQLARFASENRMRSCAGCQSSRILEPASTSKKSPSCGLCRGTYRGASTPIAGFGRILAGPHHEARWSRDRRVGGRTRLLGRHLRPDAGVLTELARYGAGARRCEHMFAVTAQGSAITRFDRAVRLGVPQLVIAAAHELPKPVLLRDALRVVLVLAGAGAEEFPAAAARFGARMVSERRLAGGGAADVRVVSRARGHRPRSGRGSAVRTAGATRRTGGRRLPRGVAGGAYRVTRGATTWRPRVADQEASRGRRVGRRVVETGGGFAGRSGTCNLRAHDEWRPG